MTGLAAAGPVALLLLRRGTSDSERREKTDAHSPERPTPPAPLQAIPMPGSPDRVVLGVMVFRGGGEGDADWRREALRDGLNASLSQLSRVTVYSREFLDFLITRKGLTEIEAAQQLGIQKMLSGRFMVDEEQLRIEVHVVDVASGVLETAHVASAPADRFLDLQNDLALGLIARLGLPVTPEERRALLAKRNTNEEALKRLLEMEGQAGKAGEGPAARGRPWIRYRAALASWVSASVAGAVESGEEAAIRELLERYRGALEAEEVEAVAALHGDFTAEQRAAHIRYFANAKDLKVSIENLSLAIAGEEGIVSYTRSDDFIDEWTGQPVHASVRVTKMLRRDGEGWKLAAQR